jgi:glycosyltransferase involved in cell wall biosynthesis
VKDPVLWDNQKLEPVLITYNRSADLRRTLNAFLEAGLIGIKLHILDNASTDETPSVVVAAQAKWPNLTYHRNQYNIGGNANILRAVEISSSEYSWILGDDDEWLLENISELCAVLADAKADIIRLGWLVSPKSRAEYMDALDLVRSEKMFFASVSMISATIIRRSLIIDHLPHAYMAIADAYPQLVPILKAITHQPLLVYSVNHNLMTHTPSATPGYFFGDLEWYSSWFRMSRFIEEDDCRSRFTSEIFGYMTRDSPGVFNEFLWLIKVAFNYKALGINQWPYLLSMFAYGTGWRGRIAMLMLLYLLFPMKVATTARKLYFRMTGRADKGLRFDKSRI